MNRRPSKPEKSKAARPPAVPPVRSKPAVPAPKTGPHAQKLSGTTVLLSAAITVFVAGAAGLSVVIGYYLVARGGASGHDAATVATLDDNPATGLDASNAERDSVEESGGTSGPAARKALGSSVSKAPETRASAAKPRAAPKSADGPATPPAAPDRTSPTAKRTTARPVVPPKTLPTAPSSSAAKADSTGSTSTRPAAGAPLPGPPLDPFADIIARGRQLDMPKGNAATLAGEPRDVEIVKVFVGTPVHCDLTLVPLHKREESGGGLKLIAQPKDEAMIWLLQAGESISLTADNRTIGRFKLAGQSLTFVWTSRPADLQSYLLRFRVGESIEWCALQQAHTIRPVSVYRRASTKPTRTRLPEFAALNDSVDDVWIEISLVGTGEKELSTKIKPGKDGTIVVIGPAADAEKSDKQVKLAIKSKRADFLEFDWSIVALTPKSDFTGFKEDKATASRTLKSRTTQKSLAIQCQVYDSALSKTLEHEAKEIEKTFIPESPEINLRDYRKAMTDYQRLNTLLDRDKKRFTAELEAAKRSISSSRSSSSFPSSPFSTRTSPSTADAIVVARANVLTQAIELIEKQTKTLDRCLANNDTIMNTLQNLSARLRVYVERDGKEINLVETAEKG